MPGSNPSTIFVDRHNEQDWFHKILGGVVAEQCLLIQGQEGYGTSSLIRRLFKRYKGEYKAHLDIRARPSLGPEEALRLLAHQLDPVGFTEFWQHVAEFSRPHSMSASRLFFVASRLMMNQFSVPPAVVEEQRAVMTSSFFRDLARSVGDSQRVLIAIDTFEAATSVLNGWITDWLMPAAARLPSLVLIVGGSAVPNVSVANEHSCMTCTLTPFKIADMQSYAAQIGVTLSDKDLHAMHKDTAGHPHRVAFKMAELARAS